MPLPLQGMQSFERLLKSTDTAETRGPFVLMAKAFQAPRETGRLL